MNSIDIDIDYRQGDEIALLHPRTKRGRFFLSDNVEGRLVNSASMTESVAELLALIGKMNDAGISARWKKS